MSTDGPDSDAEQSTVSSDGSREVIVPLRVYKAVIVFSTMFSVFLIVGGFIVLDVATRRATLSLSEINPLLGLLGLAMIAAGGALYAFATRFRARGMGNAKERPDE